MGEIREKKQKIQICSDFWGFALQMAARREKLCKKRAATSSWPGKKLLIYPFFFFKLAKNNFAEELRLYENNETVRIHVQDKFLPPLLTAFVSDGWGQLCKYCTSRGLLQCIYRTLLSFVHLWPFVRSNEFKLPHTLHVDVQYISAMDSSLIYIPAVPRVSSVSCTLVFPEVNVWPENNVLTSSLMHMHFLTFHNALSVVWTLILCTDSDVYTFQTHYVISSPVISIDGKNRQILPVRSFTL